MYCATDFISFLPLAEYYIFENSVTFLSMNPVHLLFGTHFSSMSPHLSCVAAVDTRGAPTFLPRSQALPASSYGVLALSACLVSPWSHHTERGLELHPSPGSDVSIREARLKDTHSISRQ